MRSVLTLFEAREKVEEIAGTTLVAGVCKVTRVAASITTSRAGGLLTD